MDRFRGISADVWLMVALGVFFGIIVVRGCLGAVL